MLLGMYPGSAAINRAFASFLDQIKNEREAAEPYIEQADLLEGAVALQHRTVLDAEDARGQVRAPQPLNSKFGRLARPGTTKESHEKRSRAAREAAYGSSLSGHGNQRAVLIQQMSIPGRALLKKLRVYATASCVVNVGLQSWLFWTVSNVLRGESARQDYLRVLTSSQFNLARVFQTTRLMTLAVLRNDTAEFAFQKGRLAEATETLRQSIRTAYAETLINAPTLIDLMVTPSMSEKLRTFPTDVTVDETNALYLMTEKYANKAGGHF
ncbi:MAG: hypothetical protein BJ554DRAFT_1106 [Olpidium bornovanus]|uniref:Uncharacterized protein n=1 Tax=Olpidium bornovanus TaxID=278681 RepID=A0A8H8DHN3_9FUNG|nr:MAG: hypothetical protein BJ554DRAFT_1106 [Olpidium bornovanus]